VNKLLVLTLLLLVIGCSEPQTQESATPIDAMETAEELRGNSNSKDELDTAEEESTLQLDGGLDEALRELDLLDELEAEMSSDNQVKSFYLVAEQWTFTPSVIKVNLGDAVKLNIESIDVAHGISIPAFGVNMYLTPETTQEVEFVADQKGSFVFVCSVPCGKGHSGMSGKIIVS